MKLFVVYLGGRADGCNIELHDVVFVIGETIESTYPQLIEKWFGYSKRLHIDAYAELKYVDGHEIKLKREKPQKPDRNALFFVNFGAYNPKLLGEVHQISFYVAADKEAVIKRAKAELCQGMYLPHVDDNLIIDDLIAITQVNQFYLELIPTSHTNELNVVANYVKLVSA